MKITINSNELSFALNNAAAAISRHANSVFSGVQLKAADNHLEVISSDGSSFVKTSLNCMTLEEGAVIAPSMLIDLVSKLNGEVDLATDGNAIKIVNRNGGKKGFKSSLAIIPGEISFPEAEENSAEVSLKADDLIAGVSSIGYAVAKDENRLILTGISTEIEDGRVTMTACDGYRMATIQIDAETKTPGGEKIDAVPSGRFLYFLRLGKGASTAKLKFGKSKAVMTFDDVTVVTPMLNGSYIDYRKLIDSNRKDESIKATVRKDDLMMAINCAAAVVSTNKENAIVLSFDGTTLSLSARDAISETVSDIDADTDGKTITIAVNRNYLADVIKSVKSENVTLEMTTPVTPIFITGDKGNYLNMVLPVRQTVSKTA